MSPLIPAAVVQSSSPTITAQAYGATIPTSLEAPVTIDGLTYDYASSASSAQASAPPSCLQSRGNTGNTLSLTERMTCVSAPGKVLIAGGYLVLDPRFEGLVLATSSRFYACATHVRYAREEDQTRYESERAEVRARRAQVTVTAAQFPPSCSWIFQVEIGEGRKGEPVQLHVTQVNLDVGRNKFVEIVLAKVLQYAWETLVQGEATEAALMDAALRLLARIRGDGVGTEAFVLADNDFYSQRETLSDLRLEPTLPSLQKLRAFTPLPRHIGDTNKTGLGSSAALTSSLTAALLSHFDIVSLSESDTTSTSPLDTIHALSQLSHCLAQGKVGSGFDVSSAVYGSHVYRRFSPSILTPLMSLPPLPILPSAGTEDALVPRLSRETWDQEVTSFRLPRGLRLILADVDAGTDTPSFVGKVLKYGKEQKEAAELLFQRLRAANQGVRDALGGLCEMEGTQEYGAWMERHGTYAVEEMDDTHRVGKAVKRLSGALENVRHCMRLLGRAADVPIEPPEQERLLDASSLLPGVIGGGVPGAGGYDALFLIVIDHPSCLSPLQDLWAGWTELRVSPLLAKQSDGGMRAEAPARVRGLTQALWRCIEGREGYPRLMPTESVAGADTGDV